MGKCRGGDYGRVHRPKPLAIRLADPQGRSAVYVLLSIDGKVVASDPGA
jgi:hypothetical protein